MSRDSFQQEPGEFQLHCWLPPLAGMDTVDCSRGREVSSVMALCWMGAEQERGVGERDAGAG